MTKGIIDNLENNLSELADFLENNSKNCLEKIQILAKINEFVFWLQLYQDKYLDWGN